MFDFASWRVGGVALALAAALCACASTDRPEAADPARATPAFSSTYVPAPSVPTAIINANILTGAGSEIRGGAIVMAQARIVAVGANIAIPEGAHIIDAAGRWVTPGLVDAHSHLGVMPSPGVTGMRDLNESVDPNTAQVWAEHSVWPQDPGFDRARAGGVTSLLVLPGSTNIFGGRSVVLRNVPSPTVQGMKLPDAPYGLKVACGENPMLRYGARGRSPATRMGNVAVFRRGWIEAAEYARRGEGRRDLSLETLAGALNGEIAVHNHCYRADEMAQMIDVSHEFGFRIAAFHHAVEAYKIAPLLAHEDICVATWAGRWGFKMEAYDGIEENAALLHRAGVCVAIHSDDAGIVQRLNVEAAAARAAGAEIGITISDAELIGWITANPARIMGVADQLGTLEAGKRADVVLWSANPFSVYAAAQMVFVDGALLYDRSRPETARNSDFELGQAEAR